MNPTRGTAHRAGRLLAIVGPPLLVFVAVIATWYVVSLTLLEPYQRFLLPLPHEVLHVGFLEKENLAEILSALKSTAFVALSGYSIAIVLGNLLAIVMSQSRWIERSLYPYAVALQTIPILAWVPLVGLWVGFDFKSRVLICFIIAVFPIITNTLFGILSVDREHRELFRLHGAGRLTRLFRLELPSALPSIFTGLRISAGLSVVGAIVSDFFFRQGDTGIGRLLDSYRQRLESEQLFAALILSCLLGLTMFRLVTALSNKTIGHWHESGGLKGVRARRRGLRPPA
jgi:NitT/TauT family transport system permease protein